MTITHPTNPEERNMAGKFIEQTYKGILRVANNIDLTDGEKDEFLSSTYYANDDTAYHRGLNEVRQFLTEGDENKRFASKYAYTNLKLPVTDSMGNYLNFSLGVSGSLIGSTKNSKEFIAGVTQFDDSDPSSFAVLQSPNPIKIGLSERVNIPEKEVVGDGLLTIDSSGKLVIKNNYHYVGESLTADNKGKTYRTIISAPNTVHNSDAFIFHQENYIENGNTVDCIVTLESLKDYINTKIGYYLANNKAEVPPGTIVSQYCSLDKWFCLNDNNQVDDKNIWEGYRPAMYAGTGEAGVYGAQNTIQNCAYKRGSYLYLDGLPTGELPPDFKRGYVLCNGDSLKLKLAPSYIQNTEDSQDSIRLFFNLFYNIGYYYSGYGKMPEVKRVYKQNGKYRFKSQVEDDKVSVEAKSWYYDKVQPEISYGITMATILAFQALEEKFKTSRTELTTPELAVNWLKNQKIPDEHVFNVVIPDSLAASYANNYFKYKNSSLSSEVKINIGREINAFVNKIPYYVFNGSDYTVELVSIYETAEVYHMAELFIQRLGLAEWENFIYPFYLPQLYTITDNDANRANAINLGEDYTNPKQHAVGMFIGSNGITIADSFTLNSLPEVKTHDLIQSAYVYNSYYVMSEGLNPHTHYTAKGRSYIPSGFNPNSSAEPDVSHTQIAAKSRINLYPKNNRLPAQDIINGTYAVTSDYKTSPVGYNSYSHLASDPQYNYVLQGVPDANKAEVYHNMNATAGGTEWSTGNDFVWYGGTSEPIWAEEATGLGTTLKHSQSVGYFRPESVKVLPLIKL